MENPIVRRWAGTTGAMMVIRDNETEPWRVLNGETEEPEVDITGDDESSKANMGHLTGSKRPHDAIVPESEGVQSKRPRVDSAEGDNSQPACLAPPANRRAQKILQAVTSESPDANLGSGDVFFTVGWRTRWCRCDQVTFFAIL